MANVRSLFGTSFTRFDGSIGNFLFGQINKGIYDVAANSIEPLNLNSRWTLPSTEIGTEDSDFAVFEDYLFHVNGRGPNASLGMQDSSAKWSDTNFHPTPLAKYVEPYGDRLYLANLRMKLIDDAYTSPNTNAQYLINNPTFPRRVWFSDLPDNGKITWGYGYGSVGAASYNDAGQLNRLPTQLSLFTKAGYWYRDNNIKIGDPVYIEKGGVWYRFNVSEVESDYVLKIIPQSSNIGSVSSGLNFWVGSNWFDVPMGASDYITQIENNKFLNTLLIFGRNSIFQYNTNSLRPVSDIGTTSPKSVKTIKGLTFYFHGSDRDKTGFYYWNGTREVKISGRVQPFIDAMSSSNFTSVVGWQEGNKYRAFIGDLSKTFSSISAYDISMSNAVFTYDLENDAQSIDPVGHTITSSTSRLTNGVMTTYLGNSDNEVMEVDEAYSFNGSPITMKASTGPIFPKGTQVVNEFTRIQVVSKDANGTSVEYRLWLDPFNVDSKWTPLGRLNQSRVELPIKREKSQAVGIDIRFTESSTDQTTPSIEHLTIYSRPIKTKLVEIQSL